MEGEKIGRERKKEDDEANFISLEKLGGGWRESWWKRFRFPSGIYLYANTRYRDINQVRSAEGFSSLGRQELEEEEGGRRKTKKKKKGGKGGWGQIGSMEWRPVSAQQDFHGVIFAMVARLVNSAVFAERQNACSKRGNKPADKQRSHHFPPPPFRFSPFSSSSSSYPRLLRLESASSAPQRMNE